MTRAKAADVFPGFVQAEPTSGLVRRIANGWHFDAAAPIPGPASTARHSAALSTCAAAAHVQAMNAVHVALNAILAEGGAHV